MLTLNRAGRHRAQATHVPAPALPPPTRCRLGPWSADETHSPRPSSLQLAPHSSTCTTARQPRKEARCSAPPLPRSPPASRASRVDCVSVRRGYVDARNRSFAGCPRLPLPVVPGTTTQCTAARTPFQTRASQLSFLILLFLDLIMIMFGKTSRVCLVVLGWATASAVSAGGIGSSGHRLPHIYEVT